jgi:hypothetical protein
LAWLQINWSAFFLPKLASQLNNNQRLIKQNQVAIVFDLPDSQCSGMIRQTEIRYIRYSCRIGQKLYSDRRFLQNSLDAGHSRQLPPARSSRSSGAARISHHARFHREVVMSCRSHFKRSPDPNAPVSSASGELIFFGEFFNIHRDFIH